MFSSSTFSEDGSFEMPSRPFFSASVQAVIGKSFQRSDSGEGLSVDEAIEQVGLTGVAHLPFGYLSAGQQRRIALARLLVSRRPLWLLDEPTAALDKRSDRLFADLVRQHLEAGGLAIAATHQPLGLENVRSLELSGIHSAASGEIWA
jgi:heme exporter protein A